MFRILLVDDEPMILKLLKELLQDEYEVLEASNGEDAMEIIREQKPDIVIVDVRLVGTKDGMWILKETKKTAPQIKVIMMTLITTDKSFEVGAYKNGATKYIYKPFDIDVFRETVQEVAEGIESR